MADQAEQLVIAELFPESTLDRLWTAVGRAFPVPDEVAPVWRAHLERLYELYSTVTTPVARYEQDQEALLVQTDALAWLTKPGIGVITAADAYGEWSALTQATSPKKLVKYADLDPNIYGSGQQPDRYGAISYQGSRWFRAALCQAGAMVSTRPTRVPIFWRSPSTFESGD